MAEDPKDDRNDEVLEGEASSAEGPGSEGGGKESERSADEDMKAKYRDALAHKHGSSGAHHSSHGDKGEAAHSQSAGPTQKMFRRRAGS